MRILILSDVHIDAISLGKPRFDSIFASVLKVVRETEYDQMLFLGDWSDPDNERSIRASAAAIEVANEAMDKTWRPSVWLTGNHDIAEDGHGTHTLSPLRASRQAVVCDTPAVSIHHGFHLVALPYTSRVDAYDPADFIEHTARTIPSDKPIVIIGHLDVEGATPGSEIKDMPRGREVFWPTAAIAKHMPNAFCIGGHLHERGVLKRDGVEINIVGSFDRLSFSEEKMTPGWHILEV